MINFENFMKNCNLKNDTINESELQGFYNYPIYPGDSRLYSDRGFVNTDDGSQGGSHWTCFIIKVDNSFYFDSFGGQHDKILLNQLSKPIIYHNYKIEDINSYLCG